MSKTLIKSGIIGFVLISICALPFLPIKRHFLLKTYDDPITLGSYEIAPQIRLDRIGKLSEINIDAQFKYPAAQIFEDGCIFSVEVVLKGQTPQTYPKYIETPEDRMGFRVENIHVDSRNDQPSDFGNQTLILTLYNEPMVKQTYVLKLEPRVIGTTDNCDASTQITHKARHIRTSHFTAALTRAMR